MSKQNSTTADRSFAHLTDREASILRKQTEDPLRTRVTWRSLYRFASRQDLIIIVVSCFCSIGAGLVVPLNTVVLGSLAGAFQDFTNGLSRAEFQSRVNHETLYFVYLAIGEFFAIYIATVGFKYTGENITRKIREQYLKALLRQNAAYLDTLGPGEVINRITSDTNVIQEGLSEKVELALSALSTFLSAYAVGLIEFWKLTLILTATIPVLFGVMHGLTRLIIKYSKLSLTAYGQGGILVEETISSIRTVAALGAHDRLARAYDSYLTQAEAFGLRMKCIAGSGPGVTICIFNLGYALACWQGSKYIVAGKTSLSAVLTILLVMMLGAFSLGKAVQHVQAFANAIAAAGDIYATIDRGLERRALVDEEKSLPLLRGEIEFRNIKHIYPARPDVIVLQNFNLTIPAGTTAGITGPSGSGKTTLIALLECFYHPVAGEVVVDDQSIESLDVQWLRQQIGLVSQDLTLFSGTVEENILHGLRQHSNEDRFSNDKVKQALVEDAAKLANAHEFIMQLPRGYKTDVGERGLSLSGGQRQRIAIARAVISNPKILLFDEATSALDSKTELAVQLALEKAAKGRTTIIIAHRLSTIKNADKIVVMGKEGQILEQGTYEELWARDRTFQALVKAESVVYATQEALQVDPCFDEKTNLALEKRESSTSAKGIPQVSDKSEESLPIEGSPATARHGRKQLKASLWSLLKFTASLNHKEWKVMTLGIISSIFAGAGEPVQCVILANAISTLSLPASQYHRLQSDANFWSGMFVMIAFVMLGCYLTLGLSFAYGSERLVHLSRDRAFRSILRQDIGFFDRSENGVGALTCFINTETTNLAGMSGLALGTILQLLATLMIGYIIALAVGWKLALVCISTVPVLLGAGFLSFWSLSRFESYVKDAYRESASFACEAASSTRIIAAFTLEDKMCQQYHHLLYAQSKRMLRFNLKTSILYALSQSAGFLCMALSFWYGSRLIGHYSLTQFYLVFFTVIFGTRSAANMFSLAPNMAKARVAAAELKILFERIPAIDVGNDNGLVVECLQGSVKFQNVDFGYQKGQKVLIDLSFEVFPGQYVALVGASGCGKSTIISLLERFYDPSCGAIRIDDKDISTLQLKSYRSCLALVSQEPTLFQGSIRDNLLLAVDKDNVCEDEIVRVCKEANIHDFILSLPSGLDTIVGSKGTMLSGGQKQRIAIARALLRDPKILLLDEATSALDRESESVVQAALNAASKGRTTIAVAHRLSTVRNADNIFVVDGGRIVESGTHASLMAKGGRYHEMVQLQSLEKQESR